jgi:catechol 2,3-dioxygenase-like lactoylglutathione lyase family enzyme
MQHKVGQELAMRVNRIDHFNLRTSLLEETSSFYEKLLGLKRGRAAGMDQSRNAWLYDEEGRPIVHVNMPADGERELPGDDTGKVHHIALDCTGYDAMIARLKKLQQAYQINVIAEIGLRQLFVMDPNGLRLELNFWPETAA